MKKIAVIFAGGTGQRMGAEIPKQFLKVYGKEIIIHTLELFEENESVDEIYVVCIKDWIKYLKKLIKKYSISKVKKVIPGGATGQDSIFEGLKAVKKANEEENPIVLIHDGVRPLVGNTTIDDCVKAVQKYGSAITATPCFETPVISYDGEIVSNVQQRSVVYNAKAPQCFYLNDIYNAHIEERKVNPSYEGIIDSCVLMVKHNHKCHLIQGNRGNIKVTTPEDFCYLIGNLNARDYEEFLLLSSEKKKKTAKSAG